MKKIFATITLILFVFACEQSDDTQIDNQDIQLKDDTKLSILVDNPDLKIKDAGTSKNVDNPDLKSSRDDSQTCTQVCLEDLVCEE